MDQNLTQRPLCAPSFQEFSLQHTPSAPPLSLNPNHSILQTEIVEFTPKEYSRSIEAAVRSAQEILALKLPRSCKRAAEDLAASLTQSKQRWHETGVIPVDEDIKVTPVVNLSSAPPWVSNNSCKSATRKGGAKRQSTKPKAVSLLAKLPSRPMPSVSSGKDQPGGFDLTSVSANPSQTDPSANSAAPRASTTLNPDGVPDAVAPTANPWETPSSPSVPPASSADMSRPSDAISTNLPAANDSSRSPPGAGSGGPSSAPLHPSGGDQTGSGKPTSRTLFEPASADPEASPSA
ncbi:hypothetical protein PtB15_6B144 [Puccinia triticina]|nr:hypothetical protein PtB15_6B144 [Puccinia triticina]